MVTFLVCMAPMNNGLSCTLYLHCCRFPHHIMHASTILSLEQTTQWCLWANLCSMVSVRYVLCCLATLIRISFPLDTRDVPRNHKVVSCLWARMCVHMVRVCVCVCVWLCECVCVCCACSCVCCACVCTVCWRYLTCECAKVITYWHFALWWPLTVDSNHSTTLFLCH